MTDNDLAARIDEWCDSIMDSHDPGFASIGRDLLYELEAALRARDTELAAAERLIAGTVMTVDEFGLDADTLAVHVDRMRAWLASVASPPADREKPSDV